MHQYLSGIQLDAVALGANTGASLTTGVKNVLVGAGAGSNLTTGSGNEVLGAAPGDDPAATDNIVLSTGSTGAVRAKWDSNGDIQLAVRALAAVADPPAGFATLHQGAPAACTLSAATTRPATGCPSNTTTARPCGVRARVRTHPGPDAVRVPQRCGDQRPRTPAERFGRRGESRGQRRHAQPEDPGRNGERHAGQQHRPASRHRHGALAG